MNAPAVESFDVGNVLTGHGAEFSVSPELREIMCYMEDGRMLVSKSHTFNPHVRGFQARLNKLGRPCHVLHVDLAVIAEAYQSASGTGKAEKATDKQRMASSIFEKAVSLRASDIHIRVSKRDKTRIFFRIHNDLEFQGEESFETGSQLCLTIYQSMADVSDSTFEALSRQDARISAREKLPRGIDGIRIATSPQVDGYIMVLRLLYNDATNTTDLTSLGYSPPQSSALTFMRRRPTGINFIAGPTGSGKSTTLQRLLVSLIKESEGRKHIITVEDPPEYPIPGAVQTPVTNAETEKERSIAFQGAIKAAMRLDPDVIMIGEIRDEASARLAVQAAMTGHQVWSTIHANSAFAVLDRMIDLHVPLDLISDPTIITGLTCQRLLKVLCPHCKQPLRSAAERYNEEELKRVLSVVRLDNAYVKGDGCDHCRSSGTIGRTVVAETIVTDQRLMSFVRARDKVAAIEYWRRDQRGTTMLGHAIDKINLGIADPFQAEDIVGPLTMDRIDSDFRIDPMEVAAAAPVPKLGEIEE